MVTSEPSFFQNVRKKYEKGKTKDSFEFMSEKMKKMCVDVKRSCCVENDEILGPLVTRSMNTLTTFWIHGLITRTHHVPVGPPERSA